MNELLKELSDISSDRDAFLAEFKNGFPVDRDGRFLIDLKTEDMSLGELADALALWVKLREDLQKLRSDVGEVAQDIEVKRVEVNSGTVGYKIQDNSQKVNAIDV